MVTGFMAGVALGQQLVGMSKSKKTQTFANTNQRLQSAKIAAYKRMQARQKQFAMVNSQKVLSEMPVTTNQREIFYGKRRGAGKNFRVNTSAEEIVFEEGFAREFKNKIKYFKSQLYYTQMSDKFNKIFLEILINSHYQF